MANHDYNIANGTGAQVRADLNDALAAIVTNNSSAAEPGTTFAHMLWADTTNNRLKIRNAANTDWISLRSLDGTLLELGTTEMVVNNSGADYNFRVEGDTEENLLVTDASADRVGIGTAAPGTLLELNSTAPYITLRNTTEEDAEGGRESKIIFEGEQSGGELSTLAEIEALHDGTGDDENGSLVFKTNDGSDGAVPTKRLTIDRNGSFLLGSQLDQTQTLGVTWPISGEGPNALYGASFITHTNDTNGSWLVLGKSRGTAAGSTTIAQSGDAVGTIGFTYADGTDFANTCAQIRASVDGTPGSNDTPGRLEFWTTTDGNNAPSERMRIENNGNIGVNATSAGTTRLYVNGATSNTIGVYSQLVGRTGAGGNAISGYNAPATGATGSHYGVTGQYVAITGVPGGGVVGILASVYGILGYFDTSNSWAGYFNGSTYATGSYQGSDARLKDVVEPVSGGILDKLANIQPVKYRWKENTDQRETVGDGVHIGLIAQEVEEHFPELVKEIKHSCPINTEQLEEGQFDTSCSLNHELGTFKTLEYQHLTAVLVEALKEAKERIETLETKVAALEAA